MNNTIMIHGRVGQEPELKFSAAGNAVLKFSVVDTYGKDDKKKSTWHNIVVFGKLADNVVNSITKGTTVMVIGRLEQDEYTKKDGTKAKTINVIADEVGVSCRWNAWVADKTEQVMAEVASKFPGSRLISDDEMF
jgi:single-strand DNA-binding protein